MDTSNLKEKFIWQMTGEEFISLQQGGKTDKNNTSQSVLPDDPKKYVFGIAGIAKLFDCSIPTANRIKKSGIIDGAITQVGRKIIVEAELALCLAKQRKGGR